MKRTPIPLTVWMNMPSPYQADFFRELSRRSSVELDVIFAQSLDPMRVELGWVVADDGFKSRSLPLRRRILTAIRWAWDRRDHTHVVNGVWALPEFIAAAVVLLLVGAPVYFHGEVPDPRLERGKLRRAVRNVLGWLLLRPSRGMFAISRMAERFYGQLAGADRVLPFGYFKHHEFKARAAADGATCEFIFVGQLIDRKAVDLLIKAFAKIAHEFEHVRLTLAGSGPEEVRLKQLADECGSAARVDFLGAVKSTEIDARICQADVLVLPSHFDGWGLVVNEALAAGVPVITTTLCGAADLIQTPTDGAVIPPGDIVALTKALREAVLRRQAGQERPDSEIWCTRVGLPAVVDYFLACVDRERMDGKVPIAPWRQKSAQGYGGSGSPSQSRASEKLAQRGISSRETALEGQHSTSTLS